MKKMHLWMAAAVVAWSLPVMADEAAAPAANAHPQGEVLAQTIKTKLGLSDDQYQKLQAVLKEASQAHAEIKPELEALRAKEKALMQEREALIAKVTKRQQEIIAKTKQFLTPEQYQQLMTIGAQLKHHRAAPVAK